MGELPGDFSRSKKIEMLENPKYAVDHSYKNDHVKKANRRFRHNKDYRQETD